MAEPRNPNTAPPVRAAPPSDGDRLTWLPGTLVGALALLATLVAGAVSPSLPGLWLGTGQLIDLTQELARVLSHSLLLGATFLATWALLPALRSRDVDLVTRIVAVPVTFGVILAALAASVTPLPTQVALGAAVATSALGSLSAPNQLRLARLRAPGMVLACQSLAAVLVVTSRVVSLRASERASGGWFHTSEVAATVAFLMELCAVGVAAGWWLGPRPRFRAVVLAPVVLLAGAVGVVAVAGRQMGAPLWQILAARSLDELTRAPLPFVRLELVFGLRLFAFALAALLLSTRALPRGSRAAVALLLTSRAATDIPACALMFVAAVALLLLETDCPEALDEPAPQASPSAPTDAPAAPQAVELVTYDAVSTKDA